MYTVWGLYKKKKKKKLFIAYHNKPRIINFISSGPKNLGSLRLKEMGLGHSKVKLEIRITRILKAELRPSASEKWARQIRIPRLDLFFKYPSRS